MKNIIFTFLLIQANACFGGILDELYVKTFGDKSKEAIIYVHGGPGYNSHDFEMTTASKLSEKGFFVVIYDQRGQGRSKAASEKEYSYKTYADDIKALIEYFKISDPILIGHSHGGQIAISFDQTYPKLAKKIILVDAPVDFPALLESLFENCKRKYAASAENENLLQMSFIHKKIKSEYNSLTDKEREAYVAATFAHGVFGCKLYSTSNPTAEEKALRKVLKDNPIQGLVSGTVKPMPTFLKNEDYIHKNFLGHVYKNRKRYCGIYGDEDGLFTPHTLGILQLAISTPSEAQRFNVIKGASHGVFIDQQDLFLKALVSQCGL